MKHSNSKIPPSFGIKERCNHFSFQKHLKSQTPHQFNHLPYLDLFRFCPFFRSIRHRIPMLSKLYRRNKSDVKSLRKINAFLFINHSTGNFISIQRRSRPLLVTHVCVGGIEMSFWGIALSIHFVVDFHLWSFIDFLPFSLDHHSSIQCTWREMENIPLGNRVFI